MNEPARPLNRLAAESSAYLRQHATNPVDWYPWGGEALERARREDKPIFLSIGYSACHWCHVMEHESFEDPAVAGYLNEHFVAIKVDREERPDLDDLYMTAVQMLTGRGGWPMSVFLTPDLKPFFGGTYFPPESRHGLIGFGELLRRLRDVWGRQRHEIDRSAAEIASSVSKYVATLPEPSRLRKSPLEHAAAQLERSFDPAYGGFGAAPKFPPSAAISLLLRLGFRLQRPPLRHMALFTLGRMAAGGMRDHLGGGFHRYSVDEQWRVPHFEKMLYDQALIAPAYLDAFQATDDPLYADAARSIFSYVLRDLQDPAGGFYASEDADSEGGEGYFYTWTPEEVAEALGAPAAERFCPAYGVRSGGDHEGRSVLHWPLEPGAMAQLPGADQPGLETQLSESCKSLLAVRSARSKPARDEKIITAWNGLMIAALAQGSFVLDEPAYLCAAEKAAEALWRTFGETGILYRLRYGGHHSQPGFLDDYAFLLHGFVELAMAGAPLHWVDRSQALAAAMLERFAGAEGEPFRYTVADDPQLIARAYPRQDGAEPSGNSIAALALHRLGRLTGSEELMNRAVRLAESVFSVAEKSPRAALALLAAVEEMLHPGPEIVLVGPADGTRVAALRDVLRRTYLPGSVRLLPASVEDSDSPLLQGRDPGMAYVCQGQSCAKPTADPQELRETLKKRSHVKT